MKTLALTFRNNWKQTLSSSIERAQFVMGAVLITVVLCMMPSFFNLIQKRNGVVLHDWLLAAVPPHDVSVPIFLIIWGTGFYALYKGLQTPRVFITYVWSLIFVTILRLITISLIPLNPPVGLVNLTDPLTGVFYGRSTITKDLFFSGHTSTLVLIALCLEKKYDKLAVSIAAVIVACLLIVQHVHYTIDIVAAPIIIYPVFKLVKYLLN